MDVPDWQDKGRWAAAQPAPAVGSDIFTGPYTWPLMVALADPVRHNIEAMAAYLSRRGVHHAPHGKTSMVPELFRAQLQAGAWGMTAATANQVLAYRQMGVDRIFLANELLDQRPLAWLAQELDRFSAFTLLSYVDSEAGIAALAATPGERPFPVLVEVGHAGGRTGVRDVDSAVRVARAVSGCGRAELVGIAGYEGGLSTVAEVRWFLGALRAAAVAIEARGLFAPAAPTFGQGSVLASAGGSRYFDAVVDELAGDWLTGRRIEVMVRAGAYVTHDDGVYAHQTPSGQNPDAPELQAALRLWAQVLSVPEPGLAIVGMGKRDAPYDEGFPVPLWFRDSAGQLRPGQGTVTRLNDQHGYLSTPDDSLTPGDLVCFGISHPCSAFDRWRTIPLVDQDWRVREVLRTYF